MNATMLMFPTALTLAVYLLARMLNARFPLAITNPVVVAAPGVIAVLLLAGIDYSDYRLGARYVSELLAPATAALAVPLYKHRAMLRRYAMSATVGMTAGGIVAILASLLVARALGLAADLYPALSVKSATAPIALQLGPIVGADAGLCAVLAIATGMTGALLGPWILGALAIRDPVARGLAYGSISHGIATTQALNEGELQGAISGVAMGCSAVLVSLIAPRLLPLLV